MPLKSIFLFRSVLILFNAQTAICQQVDTIKPLPQFKNEDGICIEQFDSSNSDANRFTENNIVYKAGKVFTYDYSYYNEGNRFFFKPLDNTFSTPGAWEFVPADKKDGNTITGLKMIVKTGLQGFEQISKDYSQTVIQYKFLKDSIEANFSEHTGIIENDKNVWMHPPRTMLFRILELNPFPFIVQYNVPVWKWSLMIGSHWGDDRWKKWEGSVENKMSYIDNGNEYLDTPLGKIACRKVTGEGKLPWGSTKLISYFNPKYGFVKLIYFNIDGSSLQFDLKSVQ